MCTSKKVTIVSLTSSNTSKRITTHALLGQVSSIQKLTSLASRKTFSLFIPWLCWCLLQIAVAGQFSSLREDLMLPTFSSKQTAFQWKVMDWPSSNTGTKTNQEWFISCCGSRVELGERGGVFLLSSGQGHPHWCPEWEITKYRSVRICDGCKLNLHAHIPLEQHYQIHWLLDDWQREDPVEVMHLFYFPVTHNPGLDWTWIGPGLMNIFTHESVPFTRVLRMEPASCIKRSTVRLDFMCRPILV